MATARLPDTAAEDHLPDGTPLISLEEAMRVLSRDERFMATIYAVRTALVEKGILSPEELDYHFRQWAQKHKPDRI
jgi:hypothetical protein